MTATDNLETHGFTRKSKRFDLEGAIIGLGLMGMPITLLRGETVYTKTIEGQTSEFRAVVYGLDERKIAIVLQDEVYVSFVPAGESKGLEDDEIAYMLWAISSAIFFTTDSMFVPILANTTLKSNQTPVEEETPLDVPRQIVVYDHSCQFHDREPFPG